MPLAELALLGAAPRVRKGSIPRDSANASEEGLEAIRRIIHSGAWSMFTSSEVSAFEEEFAAYVGATHAVLLNSCTTAIYAALVAMGVKRLDQVVVPAFTYIGTCMPLLEVGALPVWTDVGPTAPNLDPEAVDHALASRDVRAIIMPLLFGSSAAASGVAEAARTAGTPVIFDCAQFLGDRAVTSRLSEVGVCCFSFGESKMLRVGEGGAITTNAHDIAERVRRFRHEGEAWLRADLSRMELDSITPADVLASLASPDRGLNLRPTAYMAALARVQLNHLPSFLHATEANAGRIRNAIGDQPLLAGPDDREIWWTYPCLVREPLQRFCALAALLAEGVPVGVHFPRLVPSHPVFGEEPPSSLRRRFPNATRFADSHIVLPLYPAISPQNAQLLGTVVRAVIEDPALLSDAATTASANFLERRRLADLSSGLYMFLQE